MKTTITIHIDKVDVKIIQPENKEDLKKIEEKLNESISETLQKVLCQAQKIEP